MSDQDKPGHSHDHGHDHDHDHDHGHDHDHDHGPKLISTDASKAAPGSEPDRELRMEDTGSQALSEALQSSFVIVRWLMVGMIVLFFCSGIFIVEPNQKALILRFGKPQNLTEDQLLGPGFHFAFPYPIDEVVKIPISQVYSVRSTTGWFATPPEVEAAGMTPPGKESLDPGTEGYTISGDVNIMHVRATARYRISDPISYVFGFTETSNTIQHALDNAILLASAQYRVDDALRLDQTGFRERITSRLNQLVNASKLGIQLEPIDVVVRPPLILKAVFDDVLAAESERSKVINAANSYSNSVIARSRGEAEAIVNGGQSDRTRIVQTTQAESRYMQDRLAEYTRTPGLFHDRSLAEAMSRILTNVQEKFMMPERGDTRRELRLILGREPQKAAQPTAADGGGGAAFLPR
jgi:membrane protease subunit HflK